jgi:hypothetical protein
VLVIDMLYKHSEHNHATFLLISDPAYPQHHFSFFSWLSCCLSPGQKFKHTAVLQQHEHG